MDDDVFTIHWRGNIGYGDFAAGLGYAHNCSIRYQRPVEFNIHWDHSYDYLYHPDDSETIVDRCNIYKDRMVCSPEVSLIHHYNSKPNFRFYNHLDEFNQVHGLGYLKANKPTTDKVVVWTSRHNLIPVSKDKDPALHYWDEIIKVVEDHGYKPVEVTYRDPMDYVMDLIEECSFGIGYDGLAHQLYKKAWKPVIVICNRIKLNRLLIPQAVITNDVHCMRNIGLPAMIDTSKRNVDVVKRKYTRYLLERPDPTHHELYNVYR